MADSFYALLVAIDAYQPPVPALRGCANDIRAAQVWLEHNAAAPGGALAVHTLIDAEATRAAIIAGFRGHLGQAGPGDTALFYFSGHGSQEQAPPEYRDQEPDGLDETLVAYDSRQPGGHDLADKELAVLIAEVAARGAHVVVILDSCHSGSATRLADDLSVRRTAPDPRPRPAGTFWFFDQGLTPPALPEAASDWRILPAGPHVLLAACRDFELAAEFIAPSGETRGIFSYYLLESLQQPGVMASYRSLLKRVQTLVGNRNSAQTPQAEGDLERGVFTGHLRAGGKPFFVRRVAGAGWRLDAGLIHGLQAGSTLAAFAPGQHDLSALGAKLATLRVRRVEAAESELELVAGALPADAAALPAVLTHLPLPPLRVAIAGEAAPAEALRAALRSSPFLAPAGDPAAADLTVLIEPGRYRLRRQASGGDLIAPVAAGFAEVRSALEHIARWQTTASLSNPGSALGQTITIAVAEWLGPPPAPGADPQIAAAPAGEELRLPYRLVQGEPRPGRFTVQLHNRGDRPLFFALLGLSESFAITLINAHADRLTPGQRIWVRGQDGIPASVPDHLYREGGTRRRDVLLLLVSEREVDFSLLAQPPIGLPYEPRAARTRAADPPGVLEALLRRVGVRELDEDEPHVAHQWAALSEVIVAERPAGRLELDGAPRSYDLGGGVQLHAPAGLCAGARLAGVDLAGRALGGELLPPGVRAGLIPAQPAALTRQIGSDGGLSALELRGDDFSVVTWDNPLRITAPAAPGDDEILLAIAFDGQDYLLAGASSRADRATVVIPALPQPQPAASLPDGRRDLGGTAWILFQKLAYPRLGLPYQHPLLRIPFLDAQGRVGYEEVDPLLVRHARRVALLLHGITGDSRSIAQPLLQTKLLTDYDLILAFDYESFNTRVPETARALKQRLAAVGLGPDHGKALHCIAHSMGGLVARWLIEREGGDALIRHLIMLGTPNEGSPLPRLQNWVFLATGLGLNAVAGVPPVAALAALMGGIETLDVALDELIPGSATLSDLNSSAAAPIPYTVIAGDARELEEARRLLGKLARQGVGVLFSQEAHDLAVGYTSMTRIRDGAPPQPGIQAIPCTHVSYFHSPLGQAALGQVLAELRGGAPVGLPHA